MLDQKKGLYSLCEGQASLSVSLEDLLDRVDVGSTAQVDSQVVFHGGAHDSLLISIVY